MNVAVGIHVHAEPQRLAATLAALPRAYAPVLLGDGADAATRAEMARSGRPRLDTPEPQGPPACFNRLAAHTTAACVILLESGAVPAPGALERLAAALAADPRLGLVGPATNAAWNEQRTVPACSGSPRDVARAGADAAARHGAAVRDLAPLHSLSDFCLAVRREVVEAIGGADEGFGLGPCWEMEYSARAVRAGFRTGWLPGAFVYRAPFTARRRAEEARGFEASRRRYQDNLCGLRLRGESAGYQPHCRGEACEHFAPAGLIELRRPLGPAPAQPVEVRPRPPLVSCVMPTRDRAELALHAVELFRRQEQRDAELLIVDDGDDGLRDRLPGDPRVRYLRAPRGETIGEKRNRACAEAAGAFVAQWDDDDWYGPDRLTRQLEPLLAGRADITGLRTPVFLELSPWRAWTCTDDLHRRLFVKDVHGGTLVFARHVWERLARYPRASLAEDAAFLSRAVARGARLERVDGAGVFVYVRHAGNAWRLQCGRHVDPRGWHPAPEPALPAADRRFYAQHAGHAARPLVSCIMPTANRRRWVALAIGYFQRQDYAERELIVLDDGEDPVADLIPADPRIHYHRLEHPLVLGEKRNRACELARGELVAHWDDDDWQAPDRLRRQVERMVAGGAELSGPRCELFFDPAARRAWLYDYPAGHRPWVVGGALCYRRSLWERNRFAPVPVGEDTRFVWSPGQPRPLVLDDHRLIAGVIHATNTSRKVTSGRYWRERPFEEVTALLGEDWPRYAA